MTTILDPRFSAVFRALDMDGCVHIVWWLAELDGGVLGIAEWLVLGNLRRSLCAALRVLAAEMPPPNLWTVKAHHVVNLYDRG
jgi:hypothetical protein